MIKVKKEINRTHRKWIIILLSILVFELLLVFVSGGISYKTNDQVTLHTDQNKTTVMGDLDVQGIISIEHVKIKTINESDWICNETTKGEIVHLLNNESLGTHMACRQKKGGVDYESKPLY
jgi:hypothetical protein